MEFKTLTSQVGDATSRTVYVTIKEGTTMEAHEKFGLVCHSTSSPSARSSTTTTPNLLDGSDAGQRRSSSKDQVSPSPRLGRRWALSFPG